MLSYCSMIMYIFFNFMTCAIIINFIGGCIQNGTTLFPGEAYFTYGVIYGSLGFYIVGSYYGFVAYREFKAIALDGSLPAMAAGGGGLGGGLFGGKINWGIRVYFLTGSVCVSN